MILEDFECGRQHLLFSFIMQTACWSHLPHKLCAIGHSSPEVARVHVATCLRMWANMSPGPGPRSHLDLWLGGRGRLTEAHGSSQRLTEAHGSAGGVTEVHGSAGTTHGSYAAIRCPLTEAHGSSRKCGWLPEALGRLPVKPSP